MKPQIGEDTFSLATSGVWIRLLLSTKPYISQSRQDMAQNSLAPEEDNQVVRENAGWSRSPRAQGSLLLMLGVLRRIGQHGGWYDPSTVKQRERLVKRLWPDWKPAPIDPTGLHLWFILHTDTLQANDDIFGQNDVIPLDSFHLMWSSTCYLLHLEICKAQMQKVTSATTQVFYW